MLACVSPAASSRAEAAAVVFFIAGGFFSMSTTVIPLKIYFPTRGFQIGVAAKSLHHLRETLQAKLGLSEKFKLTLDDGTIVCDPEYFKLLEHQTKLNVIEGSPKTGDGTINEPSLDAVRKRTSPISSAPAAAKRARLSPECRDKTDLNTNQNNSQLLSRICISSVAGNVPMSESPKPVDECSRLSPSVQQQRQNSPQQLQNIPLRHQQNVRPQHLQFIHSQQLQNSIQSPPLQQLQKQLQSNPQIIQSQQLQNIQSPPPQQLQKQQLPQQLQVVPLQQHQNIQSQQLQNIKSLPPPRKLQNPPLVQNTKSSQTLERLWRKPTGKMWPESVTVPHIQQSIPSPLLHPALQGHPFQFPPQIAIPSNQPRAFPGHPSTPLSDPTIHWLPPRGVPPEQQYVHSIPPFGTNLIHPQSPHGGGVFFPRPGMPVYQPRPPPQQLTQERIYQMQVEQQLKATIQMSPPIPSQIPLPQPIQPQVKPAQTSVIQSQIKPNPVPILPAPFPSKSPDGAHSVQQQNGLPDGAHSLQQQNGLPDGVHDVHQQIELLQAPIPTMMVPSTPPALLKVVHRPTPTPTNSESANSQATKAAPDDTDSEDEHALQIVVEDLQSTSPPTLSSPLSQASSSPCRSPITRSPIMAAALSKPKARKPTELSLVSQIDDGYCSATTSSLGSADDVKRALPFASFNDCIPLHSCYSTENKEEPQENNGIVSIAPQDKCTTSPTTKDDSATEHDKGDAGTLEMEPVGEDFEIEPVTDHNQSMVITLPVKVINGQVYYDQDGGDKVKVKQEPTAIEVVPQDEVIFIDSEPEDHDSDTSPLEHFVNQGTPNSFHLSLDEDISEIDTDVDMNKSVESKGSNEDVVVAEHGAEVPVVTTPLDCTVSFDLDKCVADIIGVVNSKEQERRDKPSGSSHSYSKGENLATIQIPSNSFTPPSTCLATNTTSTSIPSHYDSEVVIEESVLIDSSNLHQEDILSDELVMGNEVVVSLEGSSQALDYMDSSDLISNLLLHSCLPQNGRRVSLS